MYAWGGRQSTCIHFVGKYHARRPRRRWVENNDMGFMKINYEDMDWIELTEDSVNSDVFVKIVTNHQVENVPLYIVEVLRK
jgi:hypothetical protein